MLTREEMEQVARDLGTQSVGDTDEAKMADLATKLAKSGRHQTTSRIGPFEPEEGPGQEAARGCCPRSRGRRGPASGAVEGNTS